MKPNRILRILIPSAAVVAVLAGCSSGGGYSTSSSGFWPLVRTASGPATVRGPEFAYIDDQLNPGHVYVYTVPLTASSRPIRQIENLTSPGSMSTFGRIIFVLVPSGFVVYQSNKRGPTSFLVPTSLLSEMIETDAGGDVFEGQTYVGFSYSAYEINVFHHPISKTSTPAFTIKAARNHSSAPTTRGMAFDVHGDLWVKDDDNKTMDEYVPPFSSSSKAKLTFPKGNGAPYGSMIFNSNNAMFVTNSGGIDVYLPPFTTHTTKAFTITVPKPANTMGVDGANDLYVASDTGVVSVFTPPFSASSLPAVTLNVIGSPTQPNVTIER